MDFYFSIGDIFVLYRFHEYDRLHDDAYYNNNYHALVS